MFDFLWYWEAVSKMALPNYSSTRKAFSPVRIFSGTSHSRRFKFIPISLVRHGISLSYTFFWLMITLITYAYVLCELSVPLLPISSIGMQSSSYSLFLAILRYNWQNYNRFKVYNGMIWYIHPSLLFFLFSSENSQDFSLLKFN